MIELKRAAEEVEKTKFSIEKMEEQEDIAQEQEYIQDNIQLLHKKIEPHNSDNFKIISRNLQLGNFSEGGHMYQMILLSYERSITYTLTQKQRPRKAYTDTFYILDEKKLAEYEKLDKKDHSAVKSFLEKNKVQKSLEIAQKQYYVTNVYKNNDTGEIFEREDEVEELPFISEHIRDSPLERSSFHAVSSNSVGGFLRKNERTISREISSINKEAVEHTKPIIAKRDQYGDNNGGYP